MHYANALTGTTTIGTGLPKPEACYAVPLGLTRGGKPRRPRKLTITRLREIPVDPRALENCAVLTPAEHEERPLTPIEQIVAAFKDAEETVGLYHFLAAIDEAAMSRSIDLVIWLRRWKAA